MDCKQKQNISQCNCTYEPCERKGACCDCISYHLKNRQLTGCCVTKEAEATYDRSCKHFAKLVQENKD